MHFDHIDPWSTIEGRHLVLAYAVVLLVQGAYFASIVRGWLSLNRRDAAGKKTAKPL